MHLVSRVCRYLAWRLDVLHAYSMIIWHVDRCTESASDARISPLSKPVAAATAARSILHTAPALDPDCYPLRTSKPGATVRLAAGWAVPSRLNPMKPNKAVPSAPIAMPTCKRGILICAIYHRQSTLPTTSSITGAAVHVVIYRNQIPADGIMKKAAAGKTRCCFFLPTGYAVGSICLPDCLTLRGSAISASVWYQRLLKLWGLSPRVNLDGKASSITHDNEACCRNAQPLRWHATTRWSAADPAAQATPFGDRVMAVRIIDRVCVPVPSRIHFTSQGARLIEQHCPCFGVRNGHE